MTDYDSFIEGDDGTYIDLEIQEDGATQDISSASVKKMKLKEPGTTVWIEKTAVFATDGTDGLLRYIFLAADTQGKPGLWSARAYAEIGAWSGHSTVYNFLVLEL